MTVLTYKHESIKSLRMAHGLEVEEFAKKVGASRQNVYGWEGKVIPRVESLCKIANAFGFRNLDFFFILDDYRGSKDDEHTQ